MTCEKARASGSCRIVCARAPGHFAAGGQWYDDFRQTTDEEVRALLRKSPAELTEQPQ
jgi:putative phosphoribosyl transferase